MTKKINIKATMVIIIAMILGIYVIFIQEQIISGLLIIAGGISITYSEFIKWIKELYFLLSSFYKEKEDSQKPEQTTMSPQTYAKDNAKVNIKNEYYIQKDLPKKEIEVDKIAELINDLNKTLSKEKVSESLMKCIRLATLIDSKEDIYWLENEAYGFDEKKRGKIKEKDIPDYRVINTEIRITNDPLKNKYTPLPYKLTLGSPLYQLEDWLHDAQSSDSKEIILTGPMTDIFRKVYKESMDQEPPNDTIPNIVKVQELKNILHGLKLRLTKFVNNVEIKHK